MTPSSLQKALRSTRVAKFFLPTLRALRAKPMETPLPRGICPLPWLQLSVNNDTTIRVCCNTNHGGHVRDEAGKPILLQNLNDYAQSFNSVFMKDLRRKMLEGTRPEFCDSCYKVEDSGGTSIRQAYLNYLKRDLQDKVKSTTAEGQVENKISILDLSLSNNCNLKCRMCTPGASFALGADFREAGLFFDAEHWERSRRGWEDDERLLQTFAPALPGLKEILTTGGEPFLSRLHLKLLERAVAEGFSKNILLRYHTNLTLVPERLFELWGHFRQIEVHASIEGAGSLNEYIRYPSKWPVTQKNLHTLLELKKTLPLWVEVHTCFQALNILRLPALLGELAGHAFLLPRMPFFIWLDQPSVLAATSLPPALRERARDLTFAYLDTQTEAIARAPFREFNEDKVQLLRGHFQRLLAAPYDPKQWADFCRYTGSFDRLRGQSLGELLPEVRDHWV